MGKASTPALVVCAGFLAGAWFAARTPSVGPQTAWAIPLAAGLALVAAGYGRSFGKACAAMALGALLLWARADDLGGCLGRVDTRHPVEVLASQQGPWTETAWGWESSVVVLRARQGAKVSSCRDRLRLTYSGEVPLGSFARVRVKGFLRRSSDLRNGTDRHPAPRRARPAWRMHIKSQRFWREEQSIPGGRGRLAEGVGRFGGGARAWVGRVLRDAGDGPGVGAVRALVLGDRQGLDQAIKRTLRRLGLSHLFAVSGLHVALVALLVHWLFRGFGSGTRITLIGVAVVGYLLLVGARPSIVRATAMVLLALAAGRRERPPHGRQALCLAAGALIALAPDLVTDLGFALTVSASAGILWLTPLFEERWPRLPQFVRRPLAATAAAQVASLPWTASAFAMVHPLAPVLNLVAIPWMAVFGLLSFLSTAVMICVPATRASLACLLDFGIAPLLLLEGLPASRWLTWPVAMTFWEGLVASAALAAVVLFRGWPLRLVGVLGVVLLLRGPGLERQPEMIALDVGQGDAILLHDGSSAVLVDGGGWREGDIGGSVLVPALARLGIRKLDVVVVTHPDVDHCRGLRDLAYYISIGEVWTTSGAARSPCVRSLVARPGMRWRTLWAGERRQVGRIGFEALHPAPASSEAGNRGSLVLRAQVARRAIVLAGDLGAGGERRILGRLPPGKLASAILKLAHHGSKTSTTDRFLRAVSPSVAVATVGAGNRYGHPAAEVLARCRRRKARVLRTDRDGMIRLALAPFRRRPAAGGPWTRAWLRWLRLSPDEGDSGDSGPDGGGQERARDAPLHGARRRDRER